MKQFSYDITYDDFNPTVYFLGKCHVTEADKLHSHDFAEIHYIQSGKGLFRVDDSVYEIQAGDVLFCNPGAMHRVECVTEGPVDLFYLAFCDFHFKDVEPNHLPLPCGGHILHTSPSTRQDLTRCCYEMVEENDSNKPGRYFMLKSSLIRLMILILRETKHFSPCACQSTCNLNAYKKGDAVEKIIAYLNENYDQKISLDQIARNMFLSPVYISKIFKEETGGSPINYLIKIRLEHAKTLLLSEDNPSVKEIAIQVGYEDVYHFSKLFKKYYGMAPLHYRKSAIAKAV